MSHKICLDNIAIVLNQPRFSENIGAAARAMRNMGIRELVVVHPYKLDMERVTRMATHAASDVVADIRFADTLQEALAPFGFVAATTARLGGQRVVHTPPVMAQKLIPVSHENRVALVFGREDRGLSNEDLRLCHALVNIPTDEFSSLNLAQAVMVMCYELYTATLSEKRPFSPRLASRYELDGMYDQLKDVLIRISYVNPENPDYWMNHIRNFFTRLRLRAREVSIIRGLIRQVNWYAEKRYQDGLAEGKAATKQPKEDGTPQP
ncbi:rRNA methyltransferase [Desulfonema ishimotonii]|uniref:tRNA (cytidine/uridine-2'-O-)-methyltransferase TrmJ n=1 Tax=Desulfonema ishimotonii TaxID=45657 RepID=A0A401G4E5_9BACT|nr:RNA methyltransferase [Desulfonema ishimotonii]GBC64090.1 rRNA methyltransferase [Desulfonema ishimotonii]